MPKVINLPGDLVGNKIIDGIVPTTEEKTAEIVHRHAVITTLNRIAAVLLVILNHQRVITGIESENEGDY